MEFTQKGNEAGGIERSVQEAAHAGHHNAPGGASHGLRLLVVGTETAVFQKDSPIRDRILAYTKRFASTDIIVMSGGHFKEEAIGETVRLYPTNSRFRLQRIIDAIRLGRKLSRRDVITVQDPFETGLAGLFIARGRGARLHVQVHTDPFALSYAAHSITNFVRLHIALYTLKKADGIRVVSHRVRESIEVRLKPKRPIQVLPIYVDIERIRHTQPSQEILAKFSRFETKILVVARLEPEKNVTLAIGAFIASAPESACLIIVGNGSEYEKLKMRAEASAAANRIFFEGKQDAAPYYHVADLVLVSSRYEGYGLVIIEALAAGKPVLSTDVGIAAEQGVLIAAPETFADTLHEWFLGGSRSMQLVNYPYRNFQEYVDAYCKDIGAA